MSRGQKDIESKLDRINGRVLAILLSIVGALLAGLMSIVLRSAGL